MPGIPDAGALIEPDHVVCRRRPRDRRSSNAIDYHAYERAKEWLRDQRGRVRHVAQVRDLLGHASILTTERYDNQRLEALQAAVERLEGGKTFDPKTEAADKRCRGCLNAGLTGDTVGV